MAIKNNPNPNLAPRVLQSGGEGSAEATFWKVL